MKNVKNILVNKLQTPHYLHPVHTISNSNLSTKQNEPHMDNKQHNSDEEGQIDSIENYNLIEHITPRSQNPKNISSNYVTKLENKIREQAKRLTEPNNSDNNRLVTKEEYEKLFKELLYQKEIISSLQTENEEIKENNIFLIKNKDKVKKTLEEGLREMEACQEKVKSLESLKDGLIEQIKLLKNGNLKLLNENEKFQNLNHKNCENCEKLKKENFQIFSEFKQDTNFELEKILLEKVKLEKENIKLREELEVIMNEKIEENFKFSNTLIKQNNKDLNNEASIQSYVDYKKLYEDLRNDFEEFKNSQQIISQNFISNLKNSYEKDEEELLTEMYEITQQNNFLIVETKKLEIDLKCQKKEIDMLHNSNMKFKIQNEEDLKKIKVLESEKISLFEQLDKIRNDFEFIKESKDVEKNYKNNEIEKLLEELSLNKNENSKYKEQMREIKRNENEKLEEIKKLNEKLEKEGSKFSKLKNNELKLNENLKKFSETNESFLNNYEQLEKENINLKEKIDLTIKEKLIIEKESEKLLEQMEDLKNQNLESINKYQNELETLTEDLENNYIESNEKYENFQKEIKELKIEKENFVKEIKEFEIKIENLFSDNKKFEIDNENFEKTFVELNENFFTLHQILEEYSYKYNSLANEDLDSLLTKNFSTIFSELQNKFKTDNQLNFFNLLDFNLELIKSLSNEFEYCYEKFIEANSFIKELKNKNKNLEEITERMKEKENRLKQNLNTIEEEKEKIEKLNSEILENQKNSEEEINLLKIERDSLLKNIKDSMKEIYTQSQNLLTAGEDYEKIKIKLDTSQTELNYIRKNFEILSRNKINLENILSQFAKSYPVREVAKNLTEILNLNQFISRTETEKLKIEEKLSTMDRELSLLNHDETDFNLDLTEIMRKEQNNMKGLINSFNNKIGEKKELIKRLEKEIQAMQNEYKYSLENSNVMKESNSIKGEQIKIVNVKSNCNNVKMQGEEKDRKYNTNSDFCSLDSNAFNVYQEKNYNLAILELTDYHSIELDDSIDYIDAPLKRNEQNVINTRQINQMKKFENNYYNKTENSQSNFQKEERNAHLNSNYNSNNNYACNNKSNSIRKRSDNENIQKYLPDSYSVKNKDEKRKENIDSINRGSDNKLRDVKLN